MDRNKCLDEAKEYHTQCANASRCSQLSISCHERFKSQLKYCDLRYPNVKQVEKIIHLFDLGDFRLGDNQELN